MFSAEDSPAQRLSHPVSAEKDPGNVSMEIGEEPVGLDGNQRELMSEAFEEQRRANSPPLVASSSSKQAAKTASEERKEALKASIAPMELKAPEKPSPGADLGAELSGLKAAEAKEKGHASKLSKDEGKAIDASAAEGDENDSFHRLYNKEIKVNQDEIPLLLLELTDIAFKFIKKD